MNNKNVLITGSTGFIGSYLVEELSKRGGCNIFCLVRNPLKAKSLVNLGVKFIYADITREASLKKILDYKIDILFHCAGYVSSYVKNENKHLLYKVNVLGTENICRLAENLGVKRMVYLSSVSVVSGNEAVPLYEDLPYRATNIYGESKIEAEKKVIDYRKKGLRTVILRPCLVYGEGEPHLLTLLKFRLFPLISGGKNKFHLVYVRNVVEAMIFSLNNDEFLKGTFFVADNEVITVKDIFMILSRTINAAPPWNIPEFLNSFLLNLPFVGKKLRVFLKDRVYSIERIKSLGFNPIYPTEQSLIKSARYFLNEKRRSHQIS